MMLSSIAMITLKQGSKVADACQKYMKPYILGTVRAYEGQVTTILPSTSKIKILKQTYLMKKIF